MREQAIKNGKDILQRYHELLKQKQYEKVVHTNNNNVDEESRSSKENVASQNKVQGSAYAYKNHLSVRASRNPPQCQPAPPLGSSKNLQQLYRNSRKEAERNDLSDASGVTLQMSSSSQCSVVSLTDSILNGSSFFDQNPHSIQNYELTSWSEKDGGILSFLIDDNSMNADTFEINASTGSANSLKSTKSARDLEREKKSGKFENNISAPVSHQDTTISTKRNEQQSSNKKQLLASKDMKNYSSNKQLSWSAAVDSSTTTPMQQRHLPSEATDDVDLDLSRVVSDDGEDETVASHLQMSETVASISSFVSWNSAKSKQQEPFSPFTTMRYNSMDIALDESKQYTKKIRELSAALGKALGDITDLKAQRNADGETILQLSSQARLKEEEMLRLLKIGTTNDDRKIVVEERHAELSIFQLKAELQKEERRNSSLLKRNETLIKESKFADQTCVELSCRNQALEAELERLDQQLQQAREENDGLHGVVMRTAHYASTLESDHEALTLLVAEQRTRLETQLEGLTNSLAESKSNNNALVERIEERNKEKSLLSMQLNEFKKENKSLELRLEKLNRCDGVEANSNETKLSKEMKREKSHNQKIQVEKNEARRAFSELEGGSCENSTRIVPQFATPTKGDFKHYSFGMHTPTSHVLAKTLQLELLKGHTATERVAEGEKALAAANAKCQTILQELELQKEKVSFLQEKLAKTPTEFGIMKEALATLIEPLLFLECELQQMLHKDNFDNDTWGNTTGIKVIDDLTNARAAAHNIIQKVSILAKTLFAERNHYESELFYWKDLATSKGQIIPEDVGKSNFAYDFEGSRERVNEALNDTHSYGSLSASTLASKSSYSRLDRTVTNDDKATYQKKCSDLMIELEKSKSEIYLIQQECTLLSKKYEDSHKILDQRLKENESLLREKKVLVSDKERLGTDNKECHTRIQELEGIISILNDDVSLAKGDLKKYSESKNDLCEQLRNLTATSEETIQSLTSKLEHAEISMSKAMREISYLKECVKRANSDTQDAAEKCKSMERDGDSLKVLTSNAEHNALVLKDELENMQRLRDLATEDAILVKQKLKSAEASLSSKCKEYNALLEELNEERAQFQQKWNSMVERRTTEETQMQETIVLIKGELMATKDEYDNTINSLHTRLEEAEQDLSSMRIELDNANLKKEEALLELSGIEGAESKRLLEVEKDLENKDKVLDAVRLDIQSLSSRNAQLKDYISKLTQKCEGWGENYQKVSSESKSINRELNETFQLLQSSEKSLQEVEEIRNSETLSWQKEREFLIRKTSQLNLQVENLESKLREATRSLKTAAPDPSHECKDCKYLRRIIAKEGKIKESEISALQEELIRKESNIQSLKKKRLQVV